MRNSVKLLTAGVVFFGLLTAFFSCQKEESKQVTQSSQMLQPDTNNTFDVLGEMLAKDLLNNGIITNKLSELYDKTKLEEFKLYDIFPEAASNQDAVETRDASDVIKDLLKKNPLMTVAYPSFSFKKNEDFQTHLKKIDYVVLCEVHPDRTKTIKSYDRNGKLSMIITPREHDEKVNYAVIKFDETTVAINPITLKDYFGRAVSKNILKFKPLRTIGQYNIYNDVDLGNAYNQDANKVKSGIASDEVEERSATCLDINGFADRELKKTIDELHRVKFDNFTAIQNVESFLHLPTIELRVKVGIYNTSSGVTGLVDKGINIHKDLVNGKFSAPLGLDLATWTSDLGNKWNFSWVEWDGNGSSLEIPLEFSLKPLKSNNTTPTGTSASIKVVYKWAPLNQGDKYMSSSLIEYCNPAFGEGTERSPSLGFRFLERLRP